MTKSSFIDPLIELLESNNWECYLLNGVYRIIRSDLVGTFSIMWLINRNNMTISKISNCFVMTNRNPTDKRNKCGRSKNKKLYPEQYKLIFSYVIKRKLLDK